MKRCLILDIVWLFVIASCISQTLSTVNIFSKDTPQRFEEIIDEEFNLWKKKHGKVYGFKHDEDYRKSIFSINLEKSLLHNESGNKWQRGLNQFSDLTAVEFQQQYLMASQNCSATSNVVRKGWFDEQVYHHLPRHVDWRRRGNFVTPVKNQAHCGSCWTFSSTGCLESAVAIHIKGHPLLTLSEQQLVDCAGAFDDHGCNGGLPSHAFEYIHYNGGLDGEWDYPYHAKQGNCSFDKTKAIAFVKDVFNITEGDENQLARAVAFVNPVSVAFRVTDDFPSYTGGIYSNPKCGTSPQLVNHAVLAVGYGEENGVKYWIVKNSWGPTWGENGYFRIERGSNMCGIADCASFPIPE